MNEISSAWKLLAILHISHYLKGVTSVCYTKQLIFRGKERLWDDIGLNFHAQGVSLRGNITGYLDVFVAIVGFPGTGSLFNSILEFL